MRNTLILTLIILVACTACASSGRATRHHQPRPMVNSTEEAPVARIFRRTINGIVLIDLYSRGNRHTINGEAVDKATFDARWALEEKKAEADEKAREERWAKMEDESEKRWAKMKAESEKRWAELSAD